jgi:L-galactose dehydrogenase
MTNSSLEHTTLGRTGLKVSVAGLGCGGHSRLGQAQGASEAQSVQLVQRALELGINFIDTARAYGTESIVGKALQGRRDRVVISSKANPVGRGGPLSQVELRALVERSLSELRTDWIDIYHLHGVRAEHYERAHQELVPVLERMREEGKLRFIGITERFGEDAGHVALQRALQDDCWDVMMVGFNLLNPSARNRVFATTRHKNIGTLIMFAVRRALSQPAVLRQVVRELASAGVIPHTAASEDPLGFVLDGATSVVEAAYRFCRHEPGADVVLTGTGSAEHLRDNVGALTLPPLPEQMRQRLAQLFGNVDTVTGN